MPDLCLVSSFGADFFKQGSLFDDVGLAALAAFGADIVRVDVAAAVGTEIGLGLDERARIGDHVDDALIKALGRNRLGEEFGNAGIARRDHALFLRMPGEHDDRHVWIGVGAGLADHLGEFEPVEDRHRPVGDHDVGQVLGEGFQARRAVFRLVHFARAEAVQQSAQHPAHMGVVVDDEKTQAVEIRCGPWSPVASGAVSPIPFAKLLGRR